MSENRAELRRGWYPAADGGKVYWNGTEWGEGPDKPDVTARRRSTTVLSLLTVVLAASFLGIGIGIGARSNVSRTGGGDLLIMWSGIAVLLPTVMLVVPGPVRAWRRRAQAMGETVRTVGWIATGVLLGLAWSAVSMTWALRTFT